jgi:hypothetical protein
VDLEHPPSKDTLTMMKTVMRQHQNRVVQDFALGLDVEWPLGVDPKTASLAQQNTALESGLEALQACVARMKVQVTDLQALIMALS